MSKGQDHTKQFTAEEIRRYWQNEMSATEMHALEKAAMEDAFLADAMEGYSKSQGNADAHLADLRERLSKRVGEAAVVIMPRRNTGWRIAAAVILLAGIGTVAVRYFVDQLKRKETLAVKQNSSSQPNQIPSASADSANANVAANATADTAAVSRLTAKREKVILQSPQYKAKAAIKKLQDSIAANYSIAQSAEIDKEAGAASSKKDDQFENSRSAPNARQSSINFNLFTGRVVDAQNNAIPSANVRMNNSNVALTDQNGNFVFKSFDSTADVSIVSSGYVARDVNLTSNRAPESITLQPIVQKSKQSAAASKSKKAESSEKNLQVYVNDAQPVTGWKEFEEYIEKNKKSPSADQQRSGEVVVNFRVDLSGKLSSFSIEKSLSDFYDTEAIRLIKEGPQWMVTKGKKVRVRVIVKF